LRGMRQINTDSTPAASSPHAAETEPDLRSTPIRTRRSTRGRAAAKAERAAECNGSRGCGQRVIVETGTRGRAAGRGCWLFQSQVVCQLGLAETDQLGFDADDHAGALVDGLADVLDQSHDVARCGAALVQQNERLGRIDLGSAGAAAFQAARFDQKRRGYLDRVLRQK